MQSRQPRLGDILDDYCPRERRLTNHAVVAMVGDDVKQTRCTTCDAEHEYKHAKIPAQRKKKTGTGALYDEVLAGGPGKLAPVSAVPPPTARPLPEVPLEPAHDDEPAPAIAAADATAPAATAPQEAPAPDGPGDAADGPVHRPLIRAQLPRPEGQAKERPIPEFTARTAAMGRGRFRPPGGGQGQGRGGHAPGTNGNHAGGNRFGRRGPGPIAAAGAGNRPPHGERQGQGQGRRRRGGRNRSK
jgi:hypothetical protein